MPHLVHAALDLLIDGEHGIWHLANRGAVTWAKLAHMAAEAVHADRRLIHAVSSAELAQRAPRPRYAALTSERGTLMPTLADALQCYVSDSAEAASDDLARGNAAAGES